MKFFLPLLFSFLSTISLLAAPSAALNPMASAAGSGSVVLSWDLSDGDKGSVVIEKNVGGSWQPVATVPVGQRAYYDRGLTSSSTYQYRIQRTDATGSSAWSPSLSADTTEQMNLIFFFADDMGYKDIVGLRNEAVDGPTLYETPALDAIIQESRVFTNAYCSGPRCVVARRSVLTGQYDWRPEVIGNANDYLDPVTGQNTSGGISGSNDTYADPVQAGGYRTCYIGKYHLGANDDVPANGAAPRGPLNQGFDVSIAAAHEGAPQTSYFAYEDPANPGTYTWGFHDNGLDDTSYMLPSEADLVQNGEYVTDRMTEKAKGFIHDTITNHSKPFFLTLAHYAVHTPAEAKASDVAYFTAKKSSMDFSSHPKAGSPLEKVESSGVRMIQDNRVYAGMMKSYDDSLQDLRDYLAVTDDPLQSGKKLSETTVIVISSDHGGKSSSAYGSASTPDKPLEDDVNDPVTDTNAYSAYPTANYPYKLGKTWVYEGGLKIPLIVHYPGLTDGGGETDAFVHGADFAATFSDIAGVAPSAEFKDSQSFMLPVSTPQDSARHEQHHFFTNANTGTANTAIASYRKGDYKLLYFMVQRRLELYNLASDLYEENDLSTQRPALAAEMLEEIYNQHLSTGANMPKPGSNTWRSEQEVLVSNGVTTLPTPPNAAPTGLTVTQLSETALELNWSPNATNATHAVIYRSGLDERNFNGGSNSYREVAYVPITQTSWIDRNFTSQVGEQYKYRIEVENLAGWHGSVVDASGEFSNHTNVNGTTNTGNISHTLIADTALPINAVTDTITVVPDEPRAFNPTLNDSGEGKLTITAVTQPIIGTVTTDCEFIYYDAPAGFDGNQSFTYTIEDAAGQTTTGTVHLVLPFVPIVNSAIKWDFNEVAGTQLEGTVSANGDGWTGVTSPEVSTNGSGQLILGQDTKNHNRVSDDIVTSPKTSGKVTIEYLINSLDLSGGSTDGSALGFGFRDSTNNQDYALVRIREVSGNLLLEIRTDSTTQVHDFSGGGTAISALSNVLIQSTLDLDTGMVSATLTHNGTVVTSPAVPITAAATGGFSALKFNANADSSTWGAGDSASIEYLCYDLHEVEAASIYDSWSSTIAWNGELSTAQGDDPDGDGYPNLMEFALGLDPTITDCTPVFTYDSYPASNVYFTPLRDPAVIDYKIQFSEDLTTWPANWEYTVTSPAGTATQSAVPMGTGGMRLFKRLAVSVD